MDDEQYEQWVRDDGGRWRCPRHPHVTLSATASTNGTTGQPIEGCRLCWREIHVCALPDDIEWPSYWSACANAFAPSYFAGTEIKPPVFACAFHDRGHLWPFMASEGCRHCLEEDGEAAVQ